MTTPERFNAHRDGHVHVKRNLCSTCVFRPGNLMKLEPGRVDQMVTEAIHDDSAIICHQTLYQEGTPNAVCRGFYNRHPTSPLQIAQRLGLVAYDE